MGLKALPSNKLIQLHISFRQFFFYGFGKIFNSGFGFEGLGAGADFLLEHECQRAAGAQVFRSFLSSFDMLGEAPVDVLCDAGVQTAALHANHIKMPFSHMFSLRDLFVTQNLTGQRPEEICPRPSLASPY